MAQVLGDIAGMLEIFASATGMVLLHLASKNPPARLLQAAAGVLILGGVFSGLCTTWYWLQYRSDGGFDHATHGPMHSVADEPLSVRSLPDQSGLVLALQPLSASETSIRSRRRDAPRMRCRSRTAHSERPTLR